MVEAPSHRQVFRLISFQEIGTPHFNEFIQASLLLDLSDDLLPMWCKLHLIRKFDWLQIVAESQQVFRKTLRFCLVTQVD